MSNALNILRNADIWVSSKKAALIVGRDISWVQKNKTLFSFRRKGSRNLEMELSSALKVMAQLKNEDKFKLVG